MLRLKIILVTLTGCPAVSACPKRAAETGEYIWQNIPTKAAFPLNGAIKFVYSNDVWAMRRKLTTN